MKFPGKLKRGIIIENYKNLIADVRLDSGETFPVFCPETDRISQLYSKNSEVWILKNDNENRKIKHEIVLSNKGEGFIMVNPKFMNEVFLEAFKAGKITDFDKYTSIKELEESTQNHLSFELSNKKGEKCFICIGIVYHKAGANIVFPTFLDFREMTIHHEMENLRKQGFETCIVFIAPRMDFLDIKFSWSLDPVAASQTYEEAKKGLKFVCYGCNLDKNGIEISKKIDIVY